MIHSISKENNNSLNLFTQHSPFFNSNEQKITGDKSIVLEKYDDPPN